MRGRSLRIISLLALVGVFFPMVAHAGIGEDIGAFLASIFIALGGGIASISLIFFNFATYFGVIKFSELFGQLGIITEVWAGLRDLANIGLIFMFLAVGIGTVMGDSKYGYQKLLPNLIIVALLINFSLFAARAVIDVSHVFVEAIYNALGVNDCGKGADGKPIDLLTDTTGQTSETNKESCSLNYGIGGAFAEQLGITSFVNITDNNLAERGDWLAILVYGFMAFIFLTITAVTFLAAGGMLIARIVALVYAMVFSPLAAISYAMPGKGGDFTKWWEDLLKNAFIAPVLFVLLALSLKFARGVFGPNDVNLASALLSGEADINLFGSIIGFAVVIAFLTTSLKMAQDWGVKGAKYSIDTAKKIGGATVSTVTRAGGATLAGGTARLGQSTVGLAGRAMSRQIRERGTLGFVDKEGKARKALGFIPLGARLTTEGPIGRSLDRFGQDIGNKSYDPRAVLGDKTKIADLDASFGKKIAGKDDRAKKQKGEVEKYAKDLGTTHQDREGIDAAEKTKTRTNVQVEAEIENENRNEKNQKEQVKVKMNDAKEEVTAANEEIKKIDAEQAKIDAEAERLGEEIRKANQEVLEAQRDARPDILAAAKAKREMHEEAREEALKTRVELKKERVEKEEKIREKTKEMAKFDEETREIAELFKENRDKILETQKEDLKKQDELIAELENRQAIAYADSIDRLHPSLNSPVLARVDAEGKTRTRMVGASASAKMDAAAAIRKARSPKGKADLEEKKKQKELAEEIAKLTKEEKKP